MAEQDVTHFTTVDRTSDPAFFLNFLDQASKIPGVAEWRSVILDALRLRGGERVLDLGCGAGDDAFDIAARVGPEGHVTGVDISEFLIAEAIRRSSVRNLTVSFEVGDARSLRFADESFDAVRTERMLMHVPDPVKALAEMVRVLKAGGRMAVQDFDWETRFCDSPHKETTRNIALSFCDGMTNGWIGRRLPASFPRGRHDGHLGFVSHCQHYLRFSATSSGRARCTGRRQWSAFGTRSEPLVVRSRSCERRRTVRARVHRIHRLWLQGLTHRFREKHPVTIALG